MKMRNNILAPFEKILATATSRRFLSFVLTYVISMLAFLFLSLPLIYKLLETQESSVGQILMGVGGIIFIYFFAENYVNKVMPAALRLQRQFEARPPQLGDIYKSTKELTESIEVSSFIDSLVEMEEKVKSLEKLLGLATQIKKEKAHKPSPPQTKLL